MRAEVAQLVEQRIRNAWVVSSNLILGSIFLIAGDKPDSVYVFIYLTQSVSAVADAVYPESWSEQLDSLYYLAPDWVCRAMRIASTCGSLLHCLFTLTLSSGLFSVTLAVQTHRFVPDFHRESCSVVSGLSSPAHGESEYFPHFQTFKNSEIVNAFFRQKSF